MVKIRLRRMGAKKHPFYRLVVADARSQPSEAARSLLKREGILERRAEKSTPTA
ncbi:MAG: hypothetical protein E6H99_03165 [Chloroflexi bacterium]|nr:MAG: hypothetical protein E6H99_03165 [Chloroflexota bacterium]